MSRKKEKRKKKKEKCVRLIKKRKKEIRGNHLVITKDKGKPKGRDHLNGIEGFWSYAKDWLYHYRGIPKKYFHLYLKEIEWIFNHTNENFVNLLRNILNQQVVKE